jgi:membrane protein implicated in regulation of membrane protease activity
MHAVYLACLFGGLVATVLLAALGAVGGASHAAGHLHAGPSHALPHGHAATPAHGQMLPGHGAQASSAHGASPAHGAALQMAALPGWLSLAAGFTLSWVNPLTIAAAALWFGGAGLIVEGALPGAMLVVPLVIAVAAALLGAALVRALMAALVRSSTPPLHDGADGALGVINAPIRLDAAGEVVYTLEGLRRSAPARSVDGQPMPRGTNVVILRRERGIALVAPLDPLATLDPAVPAGSGAPQNTTAGTDLSPPSGRGSPEA